MSGWVIQARLSGEWRRMFLRWDEAKAPTIGFIDGPGVDYAKTGGVGVIQRPAGPALGGTMVTYPTHADAEAMLAKCIASGQLLTLVAQCHIRPASEVSR